MRFTPEFLQEIRDRVPVSTVAGRRVKLRRAGRELKGLSPFNAERNPSFTVNDRKQFYHCFSSGKHGDVFAFLMETEGVAFPEAVERLAAEAGLDLPAVPAAQQAGMERREGLHAIMERAVVHYERALASPEGAGARERLAARGIDAGTVAEFRIGYAGQDRFGLRRHLAGLGIDVATMAELGLVTADPSGTPRDRFRDRIMFPILDGRGRPVAFGGRAMSDAHPAKYLNSPETPLFQKGAMLFNLHRARAAESDGPPLAVEGYLDVVALSCHGIRRVVSPLGTALTQEQAALLWDLGDEPVVAFDGDAAGRRAALRIAVSALPALAGGRSLRFALLPAGLDPDDLVRTAGPAAMRDAVLRAIPLLDLIWAAEAARHPLDTPERQARMEARMGDLLRTMPDGDQRRRSAREVLARLDALARRPAPRAVADRGPEPVAVPPRRPAGPRDGGPRPGPEAELVAAERAYAERATPEGLARIRLARDAVAGPAEAEASAPGHAEDAPPAPGPGRR